MEACDTLGVMVLDENRRFESTAETMQHLEMLVKRDRNRPSVILWSTGNEEMVYHTIEQGQRIHRAMEHLVKKLDPTRLVTCALTNIYETTLQDVCDVVGANYCLLHLDDLHGKIIALINDKFGYAIGFKQLNHVTQHQLFTFRAAENGCHREDDNGDQHQVENDCFQMLFHGFLGSSVKLWYIFPVLSGKSRYD